MRGMMTWVEEATWQLTLDGRIILKCPEDDVFCIHLV
jgi:hypothetical protein